MTASTTRRLGAELRFARQRAGLSQQELAHRAGVSRRTVISIEQGQPTDTGKLFGLLRVLGLQLRLEPADPATVSLESLIAGTEQP